MGVRFAGIAYLKVNGDQMPLRGSFTVNPTTMEKTGIAGQDGVHGFAENPRIPSIAGDISLVPEISVETLQAMVDETVTAELANGKTYVLRNAWTAGVRELNTADGMVRVLWEGMGIDEF